MPSFQLIVPFQSLSISYLVAFPKEEAKTEKDILCTLVTVEREDSRNDVRITEPGHLPFRTETE